MIDDIKLLDELEEQAPNDARREVADDLRAIRRRLTFVIVILSAITLYFAKDLFLPIILGVLIALTLSPVVRALSRIGLPTAVAAVLVVTGLTTSLFAVAYVMSGPVSEWVEEAPRSGQRLEYKLRGLSDTMKDVQEVSKKVDDLAETGGGGDVQKVSIAQPGFLDSAVTTLASGTATAMVAMVLALFLLASNEMFYRKLVATFPRFRDKKRALHVVYDIERKVSRYLFTITVINACLGLAIGCALYVIGLKDAYIWGIVAFLLNFLPYIGMVAGSLLVGVFAVIEFETLGHAILAPAAYFALNALEGQFVTPVMVGRRLELNTVSVFLTVVFWGWLWGIAGALMAVPFLVLVKVICDNVESLETLGRFLGSADLPDETEFNGSQQKEAPAE